MHPTFGMEPMSIYLATTKWLRWKSWASRQPWAATLLHGNAPAIGCAVALGATLTLNVDPVVEPARLVATAIAAAAVGVSLSAPRPAPSGDRADRHALVNPAPQSQLPTYSDDLARIHEQLTRTQSILEETYMATLEALAGAVDARDPYTYGHCRRVADIASSLAVQMGLPEMDRTSLELAALLHDIGKIGVPDNVLRKVTPLTKDDAAAIHQHPEMGYRMLSALRFLGNGLAAVRYHHERYDGSGYPFSLSGDQIPLLARVLAVADAFDAITSDRPYRRARSKDQGLEEVKRCAGSQFDPSVVKAFMACMGPAA